MIDPRSLSHAQLATILAEVQAILWQESRLLPDFPREYGDYWNPAKEDDGEGLQLVADVLAEADLMPPSFMPVVPTASGVLPRLVDAHELLWAARILDGLARVHRNVIPDMREKLTFARTILEGYADLSVTDPREQRWTLAKQ